MPIVLRSVKGSILSYDELDGNFIDLNSRIQSLESADANIPYTEDTANALQFADGTYDFGNNIIKYSNVIQSEADLANYSASTYHGMTMHVHSTGALYYAHAGGWRKLITDTSYNDVEGAGYVDPLGAVAYSNTYNDLTDTPTSILEFGITDGTNGQVLSTDGSGNLSFVDAGSGDLSLTDLSVSVNSVGTANLAYDNSTGVFSYTPPDLSSYLTSVEGEVTGSLIPFADVTYDLGSSTNRFRDLYLSGNTINLGDAVISASGTALSLPAGSTIGTDTLSTFDGDYNSLANIPSFAAVATTGDYADITNTPTIPSYELDSANNLLYAVGEYDFSNNIIKYANAVDQEADLANYDPGVYHGMTMHVHSTGGLYYAHAGAWRKLITDTSYNNVEGAGYVDPLSNVAYDGDYNSLNNTPVVPSVINDLSDVLASAATSGQVLKYDGTNWVPATDLTADSGSGITLADLSVSVQAAGNANLTYDNTTGVFSYTPPDLSNVTTLDAFSVSTTAAGNAALVYDNATGVFSYTPPDLSSYALSANVPNTLLDLGITDGTSGQVLSTDGLANFTFVDPSGGIAYTDISVTVAAAGTANLNYNNTTGEFTYTPPQLGDFVFSGATLDTAASAAITVTPDVTFSGAVSFTTLSSTGTGALTLDSASSIALTADDDITVSAGTGNIILDGQAWPSTDGSAGQYLQTDGAGNLSWATVTTNSDQNLFATIGSDTGSTTADTTTDTLTVAGGTDISTAISGDTLTISYTGTSSGISNVVEDTSPQLGGDLDVNGNSIQHTFNVVNNGASDYTFSDAGNHWFPSSENDPVLYLRRGETYVFDVNASGHPFEIRVSNGGSAYNTGVTNNGAQVGQVEFKVPMSAPSTLYYQCTIHSAMGNTINVV